MNLDTIIFIFVISYIVCGVIAYGLSYAYFKREYPTLPESKLENITLIPFGYISLIVILHFLWQENGPKNIFKYGFKL